MGFRRRARELAMQALYYIDIRGGDPDDKVALFHKLHSPPKKSKLFFIELVGGVLRNLTALDTIIEDFSSNWKISRMSCVDRNVLRIAVFEVLAREDIPVKVTINEAIDIGKKYGTEGSGAFINGILDSIQQAWEEDRITFQPVVDSNSEGDKWEDSNRPTEKAVQSKMRGGSTIESTAVQRRTIRLAPGLRKRMAVQDKETLKRGGDYDS